MKLITVSINSIYVPVPSYWTSMYPEFDKYKGG